MTAFDYGPKGPDGQHERHPALPPAERMAFVRPVRRSYRHVGTRPTGLVQDVTAADRQNYPSLDLAQYERFVPPRDLAQGRFWTRAELSSGCGQVTTMAQDLAETYAAQPTYYGRTFCSACRDYFRVGPNETQGEFVWIEADGKDGPRVGT